MELSAPLLMQWEITNNCNLRCKHCYANAGASPIQELNQQELIKVADQLIEANVFAIALGGGEPLTRLDALCELTKYLKDHRISVSVDTNGTMITEKVADRLARSGVDRVQVSLDGSTPATHDFIRGIGAFEGAVNGIKELKREGIFTYMATTLMKSNVKEIPSLLKLALDLGVDKFITFRFVPVGRGTKQLDITPEQNRYVTEFLMKAEKSVGNDIDVALHNTLAFLLGRNPPPEEDVTRPLPKEALRSIYKDAFKQCCIKGDGTVMLYESFPMTSETCAGNLKDQSLLDIWHNSPQFKHLRTLSVDQLKGKCGSCDNKAKCGGGVRTAAFAYEYDFLASDPGCWYVPEGSR
jgi:radical SAM protein with 4Fe4S-binding SPASM domain